MEAINIRLYYGGHFVSKKNKTTNERKQNGDKSKFGVALRAFECRRVMFL